MVPVMAKEEPVVAIVVKETMAKEKPVVAIAVKEMMAKEKPVVAVKETMAKEKPIVVKETMVVTKSKSVSHRNMKKLACHHVTGYGWRGDR
jgi:hypothetical protein